MFWIILDRWQRESDWGNGQPAARGASQGYTACLRTCSAPTT